ncbi:hypothetical protein [Haloferula sp.]|uniref:hypothetical protein n=1 Tax=Haloferula sp. TaxID=2497595 RepID=UPI003C738866
MKKSLALLLLSSATVFGGELPELFEKPWMAWYSGYEGKKMHFGVAPDGQASLIPIDEKSKDRISQGNWLSIRPVILETMPDGRDVVKSAIEDGWEAITPESNEAEEVKYRGTVTGGAKYEVHYQVDDGEIIASGQILDKGELTENPIRFAIRVIIPNVYRHVDEEEKLLERAEDDRFDFVKVDKKKAKFKGDETVEAVAKECGPFRYLRAEIENYNGGRFEFDAGDIGQFEFEKPDADLIAKGFTLVWTPDPAKNAGGKGKMLLEYK